MKPNLLIWGGPVFAPGGASTAGGDVGKVLWHSPTEILTVNHGPGGGYSSGAFSQLASSLRDADGRILAPLLAANGLSADAYDKIAIAGFSAFHGLADPMLASDGDRISAAVLLDACFELVGAAPKAGYSSFAAKAAAGEKLFVLVGSSGQNGPGLPPTTKGYECALAAAGAGAAAAGRQLAEASPPDTIPTPDCGTSRAENLWVLNYCDHFKSDPHGGIVKYLTEPVLNTFLSPYLAGESSDLYEEPGLPGWVVPVAGGAVLAIAVAAGVILARRR